MNFALSRVRLGLQTLIVCTRCSFSGCDQGRE